MATSGSKYSALTEAMREKIGILSVSINDNVRQKQIEAEIKRIDAEVDRKCDEIRNTPVDTELVKKQAEADYQTALLNSKTRTETIVNKASDELEELKQRLKRSERQLKEAKELAKHQQEQADLQAKHQYDRTISSVGNTKRTIELRIQKAKQDGEQRKADLQAEMDNIKAKTEAHSDKVKCVEQLYNDLKEISLKLGDAK